MSDTTTSGEFDTGDENCCWEVSGWILLLLAWIDVYYLYSSASLGTLSITGSIIGFIYYLIYLTFNFACPSYRYISHIARSNSINDYMLFLFQGKPIITFETKSYHTEIVRKRNSLDWTTKEVVTHTTNNKYEYTSCRDVSGLFKLDIDKVQNSFAKHFIKLKLDLEIIHSKDGTVEHYNKWKNDIIEKNKPLDKEFSSKEIFTLEGLEGWNMLKVDDSNPPFIGTVSYSVAVILLFGELYKIYVNIFCIFQHYTIKKEVSTNRNLLEKECEEEFREKTPTLFIRQKSSAFDEKSRKMIEGVAPVDGSHQYVPLNAVPEEDTVKENDLKEPMLKNK